MVVEGIGKTEKIRKKIVLSRSEGEKLTIALCKQKQLRYTIRFAQHNIHLVVNQRRGVVLRNTNIFLGNLFLFDW